MQVNRTLLSCFCEISPSPNVPGTEKPRATFRGLEVSGMPHVCLTHPSPEKPFSTCLVGLPVDTWPIPKTIPPHLWWFVVNPSDGWEVWTKFLAEASFEPQELEILGSVKMDFCTKFGIFGIEQNKDQTLDVTPYHSVYKDVDSRCNYTSVLFSAPSCTPLQLPWGCFSPVETELGQPFHPTPKVVHVESLLCWYPV